MMKIILEYNEEEIEIEGELVFRRFKNMHKMASVIGDFGRWFRDKRKYNHEKLNYEMVWNEWLKTLNENDLDWVDV